MRQLALLALPLLAVSCKGSKWDGVYQIQLDFLNWACTGQTELYDPGYFASDGAKIYVRHTAADSMVIELTGLLLAGAHDGASFNVGTSSGYTDTSCQRNEYEQSIDFAGSFTKDLGIEGTITIVETEVRQGCQGSDDYNESCTINWSVSGFLLENYDQRHIGDGNWGYTPSTSY
jgi:hypothetical protein